MVFINAAIYVEQGVLMSPNLKGMLEDLAVGCV